MNENSHYSSFAAAYARGRLGLPADTPDDDALAEAVSVALRLHRFKRTEPLARVRRVLGILRGWAPESLLDIGSGRGAFLWPLLDAFEHLDVTCLEADEERYQQLDAVSRGGLDRMTALHMDAMAMTLPKDAVSGVTLLEVLEHMRYPSLAAHHAVRVARGFVIASVPSKPDDNPEHIQLFSRDSLGELFVDAGATKVQVESVLNHLICVASVAPEADDAAV